MSFQPGAGVRRRVVSSRNRSLELPKISDVCLEAATKEAARVIIITEKDKGKQTFTGARKVLLLRSTSESAPEKPHLWGPISQMTTPRPSRKRHKP